MNTGSKPSGAARLPNGTNPSMCMYQVRGTRVGASLGGKGGFQCASPIPFLLFCGPSYYWEAVCLKKPFFFGAAQCSPRPTALSQHLQGARPWLHGEIARLGVAGDQGRWHCASLQGTGAVGCCWDPQWGRPTDGAGRDAPGMLLPVAPVPLPGAARPSHPLLICGGIPQPPKKGRTPGRFPGETKLP